MLQYLLNQWKYCTIKRHKPEIVIEFTQLQKVSRIGITQMPEIRRMDLTLVPFTSTYPSTCWNWYTPYVERRYYAYAVFRDKNGKRYSLNTSLPILPIETLITQILIKGVVLIKTRQLLKEYKSTPKIPA